MNNEKIKELLGQQLQLLSKESSACTSADGLARLTEAMILIADKLMC